jgi:hypothetical protein
MVSARRVIYDGDRSAAKQYYGEGVLLLHKLKERMRLGGLKQLQDVRVIATIGVTIFVSSVFGLDTIKITKEISAPEAQYTQALIEELYVAGVAGNNTGFYGVVERRSPSNGDVIWSLIIDNIRWLGNIAVDKDYFYLITEEGSQYTGYVKKYDKQKHNLIWSMPYNDYFYEALDIKVDDDGLYICGYGDQGVDPSSPFTWNQFRTQMRDKKTGSVIWDRPTALSTNQGAQACISDQNGVYSVGGFRTWYEYGGPPHYYPIDYDAWYMEGYDKRTGGVKWGTGYVDGGSEDEREAFNVAQDHDAIYAIGYEYNESDAKIIWAIRKVSKSSGGVVWVQYGVHGLGAAIGVHGDYLYCFGEDYNYTGAGNWRFEKRDRRSGALISVMTDPTIPDTGLNINWRMVVGQDGFYVVGQNFNEYAAYPQFPWNSRMIVQKRRFTDLSLIWEGLEDPTSALDEFEGIALYQYEGPASLISPAIS